MGTRLSRMCVSIPTEKRTRMMKMERKLNGTRPEGESPLLPEAKPQCTVRPLTFVSSASS